MAFSPLALPFAFAGLAPSPAFRQGAAPRGVAAVAGDARAPGADSVHSATKRRFEPASDLWVSAALEEFNTIVVIPDERRAATPTLKPQMLRPPPGLEDDLDLPMSDMSTQSSCGDYSSDSQSVDSCCGRTTLMFQRIALEHTEETVVAAMNTYGFEGKYNVVYVPRSRRKLTNLGYAFVNFYRPTHAAQAMAMCRDKPLSGLPSERPCNVEYSSLQGAEFMKHVEETQARKTMAAVARR